MYNNREHVYRNDRYVDVVETTNQTQMRRSHYVYSIITA